LFIVLNGPLGIGKSTLAEALTECIDSCVWLDGDRLAATNPAPADELEHLHSTIELLVAHHRRIGYRHFVIDHVWRTPVELSDLRRRLIAISSDSEVRCFLLTLPIHENLRRINRRQQARAIDERAFEQATVIEEREALAKSLDLGEPLDVSASPSELVATILVRLALH
jgi:adenylate kinase family enzyme